MTNFILLIIFAFIEFILGILLNNFFFYKNYINKIYNYSDYINIKLIFFINFILNLLATLYNVDIDLYDLGFYMIDNNNESIDSLNINNNSTDINTGIIKDNNINIKNPIANITITDQQVKTIVENGLILGGLKAGLEAVKQVKTISGKLLAGVAGIGLTLVNSGAVKAMNDKIKEK